MSDLPSPFVPADADLRDFPYMPLDVARLRDSDLAALVSAEAFRAAVLLWCAAWHQLPAGSLPADEQALARLAGFGRDIKGWRKIAAEAQRGWTKCSDERLFHKTVSEKVLEGWIEKLLQRKLSEAGNAKRYGHPFDPAAFDAAIETSLKLLAALNPQSRVLKKRVSKAPVGSPDDTPPGTAVASPGGTPSGSPARTPTALPQTSQQIRKDKNKIDSCPKRVRTRHEYPPDFLEFWDAYPTDPNMGKREALDEWLKLDEAERRQAIASCPAFVRHCKADPTYRPIHAGRYLAKRRFEGHAEAQTSSRRAASTVDFGGGVIWPEPSVVAAVDRWKGDPTTWPIDRIGPPPGEPGCRVPGRLLEAA